MKALIIDDKPEVLRAVCAVLNSVKAADGSEYSITKKPDDSAAVDLLTAERFDLVITDMRMGSDENEGLQVLEQLVARSSIVIVLTAYPSFPNCVKAMRLGAWDYLEKEPRDGGDPYENLIASIDEACAHRQEHPGSGRAGGDVAWAHDNIASLAHDYAGQAVAILDQRVVEVGKDADEVLGKVKVRYPFARPQIVSLPDQSGEEA